MNEQQKTRARKRLYSLIHQAAQWEKKYQDARDGGEPFPVQEDRFKRWVAATGKVHGYYQAMADLDVSATQTLREGAANRRFVLGLDPE